MNSLLLSPRGWLKRRGSDTLAATTEGASVLCYRGTPTIVRQETFGTSSIEQH